MREVKKYTVIETLTQSGIESIGINQWFKKNKYMWFGWMIVMVALATIQALNKDVKVIGYIGMGFVVLFGIWYMVGILTAGKKYWNKVKDLPEPKDLRGVK